MSEPIDNGIGARRCCCESCEAPASPACVECAEDYVALDDASRCAVCAPLDEETEVEWIARVRSAEVSQ